MHQEDIIYLLKILEVGCWAAIKFVVAPFEAERYGFNFRQAFLITTTGGIAGIIAFTFIGDAIAFGWKKIKGIFKKKKAGEAAPKRIFTRNNKFVVRMKMKYGLIGIIITTPTVISIPIGTLMTHRFYRRKFRNVLLLSLSLIIWSLILNGVAQYLKRSQYLHIPQP